MKLANFSRMILMAFFVGLPFGASLAEDIQVGTQHVTRPAALTTDPDMRASNDKATPHEMRAGNVSMTIEFDRLTERQQTVLQKLVGSKEFKQNECMQLETDSKRRASISCANFDGAVLNSLNALVKNEKGCSMPRMTMLANVCRSGCTVMKCPIVIGSYQCCTITANPQPCPRL